MGVETCASRGRSSWLSGSVLLCLRIMFRNHIGTRMSLARTTPDSMRNEGQSFPVLLKDFYARNPEPMPHHDLITMSVRRICSCADVSSKTGRRTPNELGPGDVHAFRPPTFADTRYS